MYLIGHLSSVVTRVLVYRVRPSNYLVNFLSYFFWVFSNYDGTGSASAIYRSTSFLVRYDSYVRARMVVLALGLIGSTS